MAAKEDYCWIELKLGGNSIRLYMASKQGAADLYYRNKKSIGAIVDLTSLPYPGSLTNLKPRLAIFLTMLAGALALKQAMDAALKKNKRAVIIHCQHGRERTPAIVIAFLIWQLDYDFNQASKLVYHKIQSRGVSVNSRHNVSFNQLLRYLSSNKIKNLFVDKPLQQLLLNSIRDNDNKFLVCPNKKETANYVHQNFNALSQCLTLPQTPDQASVGYFIQTRSRAKAQKRDSSNQTVLSN